MWKHEMCNSTQRQVLFRKEFAKIGYVHSVIRWLPFPPIHFTAPAAAAAAMIYNFIPIRPLLRLLKTTATNKEG